MSWLLLRLPYVMFVTFQQPADFSQTHARLCMCEYT